MSIDTPINVLSVENVDDLAYPESPTEHQHAAARTLRQVLNPGFTKRSDGLEPRSVNPHALAVAIVGVIHAARSGAADYITTSKGEAMVRLYHLDRAATTHAVPGGADLYDHHLLEDFAYWLLARAGVSKSGMPVSPERAAELVEGYGGRLPGWVTA